MNKSHGLVAKRSLESDFAYRVMYIVSAIFFLATGAIIAKHGISHIYSLHQDFYIFLTGGWRLYSGQAPHADFYSPIGFVPLFLVALCMKIAGPSADCLTYASLLCGTLCAFLGIFVGRNRFSPLMAFVFALTLFFLCATTRIPSGDWRFPGYTAIYNRWCWSMTLVILATIFVPTRRETNWTVDGAICGFLLGLLFYSKISYLLVLAAIPLRLMLGKVEKKFLIGFFSAFAFVVLAGGTLFGFSILDYLRDIKMAGRSQNFASRFKVLQESLIAERRNLFVILLGLLQVHLALIVHKPNDQPSYFKMIAPTLAVLLLSLGLSSFNGMIGDFCFLPLLSLMILQLIEGASRPLGQKLTTQFVLFGTIAFVLAGPFDTFFGDAMGAAYSVAWKYGNKIKVSEDSRLKGSETFKNVYLVAVDHGNERILTRDPAAYVDGDSERMKFNDGVALIKEKVKPSEGLLTLDFIDPFSFALQRKPVRGDALWWHTGPTMSMTSHPAPERVFREADFVLVPKRYTISKGVSQEVLENVYGPYLKAHYGKAYETEWWELWKKHS